MGGYGSGGHNSKGLPTTSEARALDVNQLCRAGVLKPGWIGGWEWKRNGERVADIRIRTTDTAMRLIYRTRDGNGPWRDVDQPVTVTWSDCRFGGRRPFLCCPGCGRSVVKLYLRGRTLCRTCHGLVYPCQRGKASDRAIRKADNIRMKLGGEPGIAMPFPGKPKGMHWKTYQRHQHIALIAMRVANEAALAMIGRINGRFGALLDHDKGFWE